MHNLWNKWKYHERSVERHRIKNVLLISQIHFALIHTSIHWVENLFLAFSHVSVWNVKLYYTIKYSNKWFHHRVQYKWRVFLTLFHMNHVNQKLSKTSQSMITIDWIEWTRRQITDSWLSLLYTSKCTKSTTLINK